MFSTTVKPTGTRRNFGKTIEAPRMNAAQRGGRGHSNLSACFGKMRPCHDAQQGRLCRTPMARAHRHDLSPARIATALRSRQHPPNSCPFRAERLRDAPNFGEALRGPPAIRGLQTNTSVMIVGGDDIDDFRSGLQGDLCRRIQGAASARFAIPPPSKEPSSTLLPPLPTRGHAAPRQSRAPTTAPTLRRHGGGVGAEERRTEKSVGPFLLMGVSLSREHGDPGGFSTF